MVVYKVIIQTRTARCPCVRSVCKSPHSCRCVICVWFIQFRSETLTTPASCISIACEICHDGSSALHFIVSLYYCIIVSFERVAFRSRECRCIRRCGHRIKVGTSSLRTVYTREGSSEFRWTNLGVPLIRDYRKLRG